MRPDKNYRLANTKPILCSKCGKPGGTLVKVDDHYEHQDKRKCRIMRLAK